MYLYAIISPLAQNVKTLPGQIDRSSTPMYNAFRYTTHCTGAKGSHQGHNPRKGSERPPLLRAAGHLVFRAIESRTGEVQT